MIKNKIEKAMKKQGRSEEWVRDRFNEISDRPMGYHALLAIRTNKREATLSELMYLSDVLGFEFMSLIYKD